MAPQSENAPRIKSEYTDIRFIIAAAIGSISIFLLICAAFVAGPEEMAKTGGINGNLCVRTRATCDLSHHGNLVVAQARRWSQPNRRVSF